MVRQRYMIFTLVFVMFFALISFGDGVIPGGEDPGDPGPAPAPAVQISNVNTHLFSMPYQVSGGIPHDFYHLRLFKAGIPAPRQFSSGTLDGQGNEAGLFPLPGPGASWGTPSTYTAQWYDFNSGQIIAWSNPINF